MTFSNDIPRPTDIPSQSQALMRINNSQLDTVFGIDHVKYTDADTTIRGKHNKSTYREQAASPGTATNEMAVYSKEVSYGGLGSNTELFIQKENLAAAGSDIQLTNTIKTISSGASSGLSFLPGGTILQWGLSAAAVNGATINFGSAFPTACVNVQVTIDIGSTVSPVGTNGYTVTGFVFRTTAAGGVPIKWFAIGN